MKRDKTLLFLISLSVLLGSGCETGGVKTPGLKTTGSHSAGSGSINHETAKRTGSELVDYIFENKSAVLNASDCPKLTAADWNNLYSDLLDTYAPAEPVMQSIDACKGVMLIMENSNYTLDRAARSSIEAGWLNGVVEDFDYSVQNPPKRGHLTMSRCQSLYGGYSQAQWAIAVSESDNIPQATACYQAIMTGDTAYLDSYNQGVYDMMQGMQNLKEPEADNGYHSGGTSLYVPEDQRRQQDMVKAENLTKEQCQEIFPGWSDEEFQANQVEFMDQVYDMSLSEEKRWENELFMITMQHCRDVLYGY